MSRSTHEQQADTLERALIHAHRARTVPNFSSEWTENVMQDVRCQSDAGMVSDDAPQLVWRAAAVVVLVSALFVGSLLTWMARHGEVDGSALMTMTADDSLLLDR
jgi:hypothetical protein